MGIFGGDSNNPNSFSGQFSAGFNRAMMVGKSPQEVMQMQKLQMEKEKRNAAQGGMDNYMDYLKNNDPDSYLDMQYKTQQLQNSYLQAAGQQTQNKLAQNQLAQDNAMFVAKANDVLLRQPEEKRAEIYQQMLPLIRQHDPDAPGTFDQKRAELSVMLAQSPPKPQDPTGFMQDTEYLSKLQKEDPEKFKLGMQLKMPASTNINVNTAEGKDAVLTKGLIEADVADLKQYRDLAATASQQLGIITTAKQALQTGVTGMGQKQLLELGKAMKAAGIPVDDSKLGNQQAIEGYLKQFNLNNMQYMKGAISDREQEMLAQASPELTKTKEGNIQLMNLLEAGGRRTIAQAEFRRSFLQQNKSLAGADEAWSNFLQSRPLLNQDDQGRITGVNTDNSSKKAWQAFLNPDYKGSFTPSQEGEVKKLSDAEVKDLYDQYQQKGVPKEKLDKIMEDIGALRGSQVFSDASQQNIRTALSSLTPKANPTILDAITKNAPMMAEAGINTPQRQAAFIAQLAHETAGFKTMREYASGQEYEGRRSLGNTNPGDGQRYKGRGLIQLTGKANYASYGKQIGVDLVNNPELAEKPDVAMKVALAYWNNNNLNAKADRGDIRGITKVINGGYNGLANRERLYKKALQLASNI